jgi:hypothetical protein
VSGAKREMVVRYYGTEGKNVVSDLSRELSHPYGTHGPTAGDARVGMPFGAAKHEGWQAAEEMIHRGSATQ